MTEIRKITLQFPSLRAFLAEYGERISGEGMLLMTEAPPAAGSTVDIEVVVAEGMRLVQARGETLWSGVTGAGAGRKAVAVRFQRLDDASRTVVGRIVDQRRREGAEPFSLEDVPGPREARLRDLTVPATVSSAESPEAEVAGDSVFDLDEPTAAAPADLFSPVGVGEVTPPPAVEPPARDRTPTPPVPPLADPDPGPFDLGPEIAAGEEEVAAAGLEPEPAPPPPSETGPSVRSDLSDLFGGEEPETAPAGGRTEAFPPSFVDEVEAELEAADRPEAPASSYSLVDTGELEVQLGASIDEPEDDDGAAEASVVIPEAPSEAAPEPRPLVEAKAVGEPEPALDQSVDAEQPEGESRAMDDEPPLEAETVTAEAVPEIEPEAPAEQEAGGEPEGEIVTEPEEARESAAEQGPETVEIPIVSTPPAAGESAPAEPPVPVEPPPPKMPSPAVTAPPVETPVPALDDNLLSIPELKETATDGEVPAEGQDAGEVLPSAQSLRGAASSSRHVGTWLLIVMLLGALGVAGYFLMGLMRSGGDVPEATAPDTAPANRPVSPAPAPATDPVAVAAGVEGSGEAEEESSEAAPEAEEDVAPVAEEDVAATAQVAVAEPEATEPTARLTGLDRITWNETEEETILVLVGDGAIPREQIELVTLAGAQPRLVIKIAGVERAFQPSVLEVGTSHVQRVRTGLQAGGELHVVVDLSGAGVSMRDLAARGERVEVRFGAE